MTRYGLEMADKHLKIMYEELGVLEAWIYKYRTELNKLEADKDRMEYRIIEARKFIESEKERLNEQQ